ncbi:MAG: hypothetical protein ACLP9K_03040 [Nitrososphaerales archaeon]
MKTEPRSVTKRSAALLLLVVFVVVVCAGYLTLGTFATGAPVNNSSLPQNSFTATTFQVYLTNSSVALNPGIDTKLVFDIETTTMGTFLFGVMPVSQSNVVILNPNYITSLPDGISASFPSGTGVTGTTLQIPVILKNGDQITGGLPQLVSLKFVVYESEADGTYLGQAINFTAQVG